MMKFGAYAVLAVLLPCIAGAQTLDGGVPAASTLNPAEIALSPTRFELPMPPGSEKTVVVNVVSSGGRPNAPPIRLFASLGDWNSKRDNDLVFDKPGSMPGSAAPWMIYSPVELVVTSGKSYPIRVTISVPPDASPGDHRAALFVEERPPDIKTRTTKREVMVRFRLAAIFYIMVPPLKTKGSLIGLSSTQGPSGIEVNAVLKNEGNSLVRPYEGAQIISADGGILVEIPMTEGSPVLGGAESERSLELPGKHPGASVRYRVDFRDGSKIVEGRTTVKSADAGRP